MVVSGSIIFFLGLSLSLQEVLSAKYFEYFLMNEHWQEGVIRDEFMIRLILRHKLCEMDLYLSSALIANNYGQKSSVEVDEYSKRPQTEGIESCYYIGKILSVPNSWVAVTTCHGIEGVVYDGIGKYRMMGPDFLGDGKLRIYGYMTIESLDNGMDFLCGGYGDKSEERSKIDEKRRFKRDQLFDTSTYFVEMMLYIDHSFYEAMNGKINQVYARCQEIINVVNAFYQSADLFVTIVDIDIETRPDVIKHDMEGFCKFTRGHFHYYESIDNIQLLTRKLITIQENETTTSVRVHAKFGSMCELRTCHGMVSDKMGKEDIESTASLLSLAIARNLGVVLDEKDEACFSGSQPASDCSVFESIKEVLRKNSFRCLNNKPHIPFAEVPKPPPQILVHSWWSIMKWVGIIGALIILAYSLICYCGGFSRHFSVTSSQPTLTEEEFILMQDLGPAENAAAEDGVAKEENDAAGRNDDEEENDAAGRNADEEENVAAGRNADEEENVAAGRNADEGENVAAGRNADEGENVAAGRNDDEEENVAAGRNADEGENIAAGRNDDEEENVSDSQLVTETQWNSEKKEETEQSSSSPETCRRTSLPTFQSSQSDLQLSETHSNLVRGEEIAQPSTSGVIPKRESNIERAQSAQSETHFSRRSEEEIRTSPEDESWMKPPPPTDTSSAPEIRLCDTPESIKHARRHRFQSALSASSESSCPSSDPPVYSDTSSREGIQRTISPGRTTSISPLETHSDPERNIHPPRSLQNPSSVSSVSHPSPHLPVYSEISNPAIPIPKASSLEIPPSPSGCEHNTMRECSSLPSVPESLSIQLRRSRARSRLDDLQQLETLSEQERVPSSEFHYLSPPPKYENIYGLPELKLFDPPNSKKTDLPDPVIFHRSRVPSLADLPSIPNSPSIADAVFGGSEQSTTDSVPVVSPSEPSDGPSSEILSSPISDEQMPSSSREEIFQPGPQNHSNAGNESQFAKSSSSQELPPLCSGREPVRASYSLPSEIHLNQQISDEQVPESSSSQEIQTGISTFERSTDLLQRETQSDPERDNQTYRSLSTKATMQSSDSKCENYCLQPEPHLGSRDDTLPRSLTSSNTSFSETQEGTLYTENEIKTGLTSNDLQPSEIHSHERAESLSSSEQWSTTSIDPQSTETDWTPTEETRLESLTSEEIINTPSPPLHQHSSPIQKDDPTPAVSKNVETQSFQSDSIRQPSSSSDLQTLKTHADSRADIEKGESSSYQRISLKPSSSAPASLHHLAQSKAQSDPRASDRTPLGTKISVSSPSKCKPLILSDSKLSRHKPAITSSSREISMPDSDNVVPTRSDSAPPIIRSSRRNHGGSNEDRMQLEASSLETPLELESPTPSDVLPSEPRASSREDV